MSTKKLLVILFIMVLIGLFQTGCGGEEETTQKNIILPPPLTVHTLDIKWPVGATINYDLQVTSETHYYYLREGESLKEYDVNFMCRHGYDVGNTPNGNWDYTDQVCSRDDAGKSPLHIFNENFSGDFTFKIYGKVDEDLSPCASGCQTKRVYYYSSLEARGDEFTKEIMKDAWYYDSGNSVWKTADDVLTDSDENFVRSALKSYYLNLSGYYYIRGNSIGGTFGSLPGGLNNFFDSFNVIKYQPWKDTAWPSGIFGGAVAQYAGKDRLTLYYNGSPRSLTTYKVNLYLSTPDSGALVENYIKDCLDSDQYGFYSGETTEVDISNSCLSAVLPAGAYWVDGHNIVIKEVAKLTSVRLIDAGFDCVYVNGNNDRIWVHDTSVDYDVNGLPQGTFSNCNPDNIKKYVAYEVTNTYIVLVAKDWQQ